MLIVWKPLMKVSGHGPSQEHKTNPFKILSSCLLPVEIRIHFLRTWPSSAAVMKPLADGWKTSAKFQTPFEGRTYSKLLSRVFDLLDLDFREAFDAKESLRGAADETLEKGISHYKHAL